MYVYVCVNVYMYVHVYVDDHVVYVCMIMRMWLFNVYVMLSYGYAYDCVYVCVYV